MKSKLFVNKNRFRRGTFFDGMRAYSEVWKLLSGKKTLALYFAVPFVLNIALLSAIFYFAFSAFEPWLGSKLSGDQWYFDAARLVTGPLLLVFITMLTVIIYSIAGSVIIAPFNEIISRKVENIIAGEAFNEASSVKSFFSNIARTAANVVKLAGILFLANIIFLFLNFIPVLGSLLYTAAGFVSGLFFIGFQFFDFPLERRRYGFGEKLSILFRYRYMVCGTGLGFFLISFVPVIGFMGLNLGAAAAAWLYCEKIAPSLTKGSE